MTISSQKSEESPKKGEEEFIGLLLDLSAIAALDFLLS
jgi:hypothetical protein